MVWWPHNAAIQLQAAFLKARKSARSVCPSRRRTAMATLNVAP